MSTPNHILHINSTTGICSVALSDGDKLLSYKETTEANSHTEVITIFIRDIMKQVGVDYKDLSAVSLASGPGSYTSLRVGCSTAKGICFANDIPLITIPSLDILASSCISKAQAGDYIIPMIDARRMEVYTAVYDHDGNKIDQDHALIVDETAYGSYVDGSITHHLAGNGAKKTIELLPQQTIKLHKHYSSAIYMVDIANNAFLNKDFSDLGYFEPFYLKGANITKSKKKYFGKNV